MPPLSATALTGFGVTGVGVAGTGVVAEPRWSPEGRRLGWLQGAGRRCDLVVAPISAGAPGAVDRAPRVVTGDAGTATTRSTGGGVWCWVGSEHLAVVDPDGRLLLVPVAVEAVGAPGEPRVLSSARVLSSGGRPAAPAAPVDGSRVAFVLELDDACDVMVVDLESQRPPWRVSCSDFAWDPAWSPDGSRLAWHEWDLGAMSWESSRIVVRDGVTIDGHAGGSDRERIVAGGPGTSVGQPRFSPTGDALAWVTDESGWWNVAVAAADGADPRPVLPEPYEQAEPAWGVGQRSFAWAPDGHALAVCRNEAGFGRLVVAPLPGGGGGGAGVTEPRDVARGWHHGIDWGPDGIAAVRSGARTPPTVCITHAGGESPREAGGEREVVAEAAPAEVRDAGLIEPELVSWPADDGTTIHGLLFRPRDGETAPPIVVDVHGGPTGQATVQWKPLYQHLVTGGCAVLAPDPRGSTGHGRAYAQALAQGWGDLDVADCAAGVRAAVERGWCDPARVVVSGASSGGLTALLLAARQPELVRAVVATYAVSDLVQLAATTHRFESHYTDWLVGELPRDEARYRNRSPITHAGSIRAPVLLLHGDADRVVPPEQAEALAAAIRAAGGDVEHHVYADEGHGWSRADTLLDVYARIDDFLGRHCGLA